MLQAIEALKGTTIDDVEVEISLAKPQMDKPKKKPPVMMMMRGNGRGGPPRGDFGSGGGGHRSYGALHRGMRSGSGGGGGGGGYAGSAGAFGATSGYGYNNGGGYASRAPPSYPMQPIRGGAPAYPTRQYDPYASYAPPPVPPAPSYYNDPYMTYPPPPAADFYGTPSPSVGGYAAVSFVFVSYWLPSGSCLSVWWWWRRQLCTSISWRWRRRRLPLSSRYATWQLQ